MSWPQRKEQPRRSPTLGNGDNSQSAFYCQSDSSTQRHYSQSTRAGSLQTWLVADRQVFTQPSPRGSPGMQGDPNPPPGTGQARLGLHCPLQHKVPSIGQFLGSFWLSWKLPREGVGDGGDQNWGNRAGAVRQGGEGKTGSGRAVTTDFSGNRLQERRQHLCPAGDRFWAAVSAPPCSSARPPLPRPGPCPQCSHHWCPRARPKEKGRP